MIKKHDTEIQEVYDELTPSYIDDLYMELNIHLKDKSEVVDSILTTIEHAMYDLIYAAYTEGYDCGIREARERLIDMI